MVEDKISRIKMRLVSKKEFEQVKMQEQQKQQEN
tara:strand:- start:807 stop:908 length:102 start_codon:yes stop_codon:yes gene_type:complete